jgi:16S rRNA (guanine527-N7)-methyltransferase
LSIVQRLAEDTASFGITLSAPAAAKLTRLLDELERWNRTYNLTSIRKRANMLTHHILDSLAIHSDLRGATVADVGTGAGFPGLPLALVNPEKRFTLIDSNGKKIRFVEHAAHELGLTNVESLHARAESLKPQEPFDTVVTRAFAPLPQMLAEVAPLCGPNTRVLAMKGKWPHEELAALPPGWRHEGSRDLKIPGLYESRCVIVLMR